MNQIHKNFIAAVEDLSRDTRGEVVYAYVAGYYESMLKHLAQDFPEVEAALAARSEMIRKDLSRRAA